MHAALSHVTKNRPQRHTVTARDNTTSAPPRDDNRVTSDDSGDTCCSGAQLIIALCGEITNSSGDVRKTSSRLTIVCHKLSEETLSRFHAEACWVRFSPAVSFSHRTLGGDCARRKTHLIRPDAHGAGDND